MNFRLQLISVCLLVVFAEGEVHPSLATLTTLGDYVHVDGVWVPDVRTKENKLMPAVVDYSCYRQGARELVGTDAFCVEVTATPAGRTIHIDTNFLKVIAWTKTVIQATSDNGDPDHLPCVINEVTFNL